MTQPAPVPNHRPPVWDQVIEDVTRTRADDEQLDDVLADMRERDRIGRERYPARLQAYNGRDGLLDAYEELLDATAYLWQAMEEGQPVHAEYFATLMLVFSLRRRMGARLIPF